VHQARFTNHYYLANHSRLGDGELPPNVEGPGDARRAVAAEDAAGADALGDAVVGDRLHSALPPAVAPPALQQPHDAGAELAPAVAASTSTTPAAWLAAASCISALAASSPRGSTPLFQGRTERETH
jgi:hypothetical protein